MKELYVSHASVRSVIDAIRISEVLLGSKSVNLMHFSMMRVRSVYSIISFWNLRARNGKIVAMDAKYSTVSG